MRFLAITLCPLLVAAAMPATSPYDPARGCPDTPMSLARKHAEKPQLRRLDQLPPASAFAAVDRRVDGCPAPLLLSRSRH